MSQKCYFSVRAKIDLASRTTTVAELNVAQNTEVDKKQQR